MSASYQVNDDNPSSDGEFTFGADGRDFAFTEYEAFESLLDMSRNQNRETFKDNIKYLPNKRKDSSNLPDPRAGLSNTIPWEENKEKQNENVTQAYHDFVLHRQKQINMERVKEINLIEEDQEARNMTFPFVSKKRNRNLKCNRNQTLGSENFFDKTISFLMEDTLDNELIELLKEGNIEMDRSRKDASGNMLPEDECGVAIPDMQNKNQLGARVEYIVDDKYYPGLIDDAVHEKVDFNKIAFDIAYGDNSSPALDPDITPLSLVEAFELRLDREQGAIKNAVKIAPYRHDDIKVAEKTTSSINNKNDDQYPKITGINRDELILANAVEVDLAAIVKNKPMNELDRAIICLQRAEIMNDYDKSLQAAEEAFRSAPPDQAESAAVYKASTFKTDEISKREVTLPSANYRPIEIVSYMGLTKPIIEDWHLPLK